jgi:ribosomal protein S20
MPNIKSAKKRMVKSREQNARNRARRSMIRTAIKRVRATEDGAAAEKPSSCWTGPPRSASSIPTRWRG